MVSDNPDYIMGTSEEHLLATCLGRYISGAEWYLVDSLARWIVSYLESVGKLGSIDTIVPIPGRIVKYSYDPNSLLASWVSQVSGGKSFLPELLIPLVNFNEYPPPIRVEFSVKEPSTVKGKNLLLLSGYHNADVDSAREAISVHEPASFTSLSVIKLGP